MTPLDKCVLLTEVKKGRGVVQQKSCMAVCVHVQKKIRLPHGYSEKIREKKINLATLLYHHATIYEAARQRHGWGGGGRWF